VRGSASSPVDGGVMYSPAYVARSVPLAVKWKRRYWGTFNGLPAAESHQSTLRNGDIPVDHDGASQPLVKLRNARSGLPSALKSLPPE